VRLFVAVDPDVAARAAISASVTRLREQAECRQAGLSRRVTWVAERNLHLTVHFLGEIDDARVPGLQSALARPLGVEPAEVGFGGWGVFPSHGPPRVIWIGAIDGLSPLERAHAVLGERLTELGLGSLIRRFSPHLTVGRVKAPVGGGLRELVAGGNVPVAARCTVTRCTLYRSRLSADGATYEALIQIPLQS
jgi:2'-5' RNA ligase